MSQGTEPQGRAPNWLVNGACLLAFLLLAAWFVFALRGVSNWYLAGCGGSGNCGGARLFIEYWWLAFLPLVMAGAYFCHSRYERLAFLLFPRPAELREDRAGGRLGRVLLLGAIALLSAWVQSAVVTRTEVNAPLRADAKVYFSYAYNLRHFDTYSGAQTWSAAEPGTAMRIRPERLVTPGYPLFLNIVGEPQPSPAFVGRVQAVQAALGVATVLLIYLLAASFLPPWLAMTAAVLAALSPQLVVTSTYLLTETLFTFLLMLSSLLSLRALARPASPWRFALAGLAWGLCALVRPTALFVVPAFFVVALVLPSARRFLRGAAIALLCLALVQSPWVWRNAQLAPEPARPSLMVNFLNLGAYPDFMYRGNPESLGRPYAFDPDVGRIQRDLPSVLQAIYQRAALEPVTYLRWYLVGKPAYFLSENNIDGAGETFIYPVTSSPYLDEPVFRAIREWMRWLHWPLMLVGLACAIAVWLPIPERILRGGSLLAARAVSFVFAYALAFHMIGAPLPRYGIPFRPLLIPLALLAAWMAGRWFSARPTRQAI